MPSKGSAGAAETPQAALIVAAKSMEAATGAANAALPKGGFWVAEGAVIGEAFAAVVVGEEDEGVLGGAVAVGSLEDAANGGVHGLEHGLVLGEAGWLGAWKGQRTALKGTHRKKGLGWLASINWVARAARKADR